MARVGVGLRMRVTGQRAARVRQSRAMVPDRILHGYVTTVAGHHMEVSVARP